VLRLVKVPEHGGSVLSTRSAKGSIWGDGDGVDVTGVTDVVSLEAAGGELPNLNELVPSGGDNNWVLWVWRESDAGNPLGVALLGDGELAVTKGVPELDGAVTGTRDDLTVVGREGDRENVVGVSDETTGGGSGGELPETESLIPGSGKGVSTVRGDNTVGDDVRVTVKGSLWVTVGGLVAGQVPDDEGLVTGTGKEHVWVLQRGSQTGDPAAVALEGTLKNQLLSHVGDWVRNRLRR